MRRQCGFVSRPSGENKGVFFFFVEKHRASSTNSWPARVLSDGLRFGWRRDAGYGAGRDAGRFVVDGARARSHEYHAAGYLFLRRGTALDGRAAAGVFVFSCFRGNAEATVLFPCPSPTAALAF